MSIAKNLPNGLYRFMQSNMPEWLNYLKDMNFNDPSIQRRIREDEKESIFPILSIHDECYCLVGEAHGWDGDYYNECEKCTEHADSIAALFCIHDESQFHKELEEFKNHYYARHENDE